MWFCCLVVLLSGGFVVSSQEDRPANKGTILHIRLQTDQPNTKATSLGWKPIPSEARVTRDGVSGFTTT